MISNRVRPELAPYHRTLSRIRRRLKVHGIDLTRFVKKDLVVYESALDGISFRTHAIHAKRPDDFTTALRAARNAGRPSFREGADLERGHWAVDASMAATTGMGFREITYVDDVDRPARRDMTRRTLMQMRGPAEDPVFSAQFAKNTLKVELSSLHCAVWGDFCSIHIDETGFVVQPVQGLSEDVIVTADFLQHTLLELLWKEKLGMPDAVEIFAPSSGNAFSRFGLRATAPVTSNVRLTVTASYNVRGTRGFSKTLMLSGEF